MILDRGREAGARRSAVAQPARLWLDGYYPAPRAMQKYNHRFRYDATDAMYLGTFLWQVTSKAAQPTPLIYWPLSMLFKNFTGDFRVVIRARPS